MKRRRVGAKIDTVAASAEVAENEKKLPDLVELSKDLPSGWQVYPMTLLLLSFYAGSRNCNNDETIVIILVSVYSIIHVKFISLLPVFSTFFLAENVYFVDYHISST